MPRVSSVDQKCQKESCGVKREPTNPTNRSFFLYQPTLDNNVGTLEFYSKLACRREADTSEQGTQRWILYARCWSLSQRILQENASNLFPTTLLCCQEDVQDTRISVSASSSQNKSRGLPLRPQTHLTLAVYNNMFDRLNAEELNEWNFRGCFSHDDFLLTSDHRYVEAVILAKVVVVMNNHHSRWRCLRRGLQEVVSDEPAGLPFAYVGGDDIINCTIVEICENDYFNYIYLS